MNRLLLSLALIPVLSSCSALPSMKNTVIEGLFGFKTTTKKNPEKLYSYCKNVGFYYDCASAPKPHPDMESYPIVFDDDIGVCRVSGITKYIPKSGQLKLKADDIANKVKNKYGKWDEKISDGDSYYYSWQLNPAIDRISEIEVGADTTSIMRNRVYVSFDTTLSDCSKW